MKSITGKKLLKKVMGILLFVIAVFVLAEIKMINVYAATSNLSYISVDSANGCDSHAIYAYTDFYCNFWESDNDYNLTSFTASLQKDGMVVAGETKNAGDGMHYTFGGSLSFYVTETGTYTLSRTATCRYTDGSTGTLTWNDSTFYVYSVDRCGVELEASNKNVTLSMTDKKTDIVVFKALQDRNKGKVLPRNYTIYWEAKSGVTCKWGGWHDVDGSYGNNLTIDADQAGEYEIAIELKETNTNTVIDTIYVYVTVGPVYTISYDLAGGNGSIASQTKYYGYSTYISTQKPTKYGYEFQGWAKSANQKEEDYKGGEYYNTNADLMLYAVWKPNKYRITYDLNGGTGQIEDQTKYFGVDLRLTSDVPTKTGYDFLGWGWTSFSETPNYKSGGVYDANISWTLHAVWKIKEFTVKYDLNGGEGAVVEQKKIYDEVLLLRSDIPTKKNYVFLGWSEDPNAVEADYMAGNEFDKNDNVILYAVWEKEKVKAPNMTIETKPVSQEIPEGGEIRDTRSNGNYRVMGEANGKLTVEYMGTIDGTKSDIRIPDYVVFKNIKYEIVNIRAGALKDNKNIKSVVIGKNVTRIGNDAFSGCTKLKMVTIGSNVELIGKNAFKDCRRLKKILVKTKKLKKVGNSALKGIHAKCKIKVPKAKLKEYQKLFKKKGQKAWVKISN